VCLCSAVVVGVFNVFDLLDLAHSCHPFDVFDLFDLFDASRQLDLLSLAANKDLPRICAGQWELSW
jgi:hypothetical protein